MFFAERECPSPSGRPTVVLLHSSASSARQWQGLIETLQPRFRALAVEFHGHGARSDWRGDSPMTLADDAALVESLLVETGGAHVVGHSFGAAVALKLATLRPKLVHSVVAYEPVLFRLLVDDTARAEREVVAVADFIRDQLARDEAVPAAKRFIDFWSGAGAWESLPAGPQEAIATRMRSVLRQFDALFRDPLQCAQLAYVRMPMLILTGARTVTATRRIGELLRAALPLEYHEVLPEMGHMGPITHAAVFNRRSADFLLEIVAPDRVTETLNPRGTACELASSQA
jgi:pimeloyl-ACP methyl ester carboxylesterase